MSSFEFLKSVDPNLAQLAQQSEQTVWSNPRATLIQGRLFGEQLAAQIAKLENVEPVYAIKQIDRLHMLRNREIISDEIRNSFEWLRMNGNSAAHDAKEVPSDLALTAHRHIYALSAWYAEAYGPLDLVLPAEYRMPVPVSSVPADEAVKQPSQEALSERLEQLLKDQLADKLLPSIDERFREMSELLAKFAGQMDAWAQKDSGRVEPDAQPSPSSYIGPERKELLPVQEAEAARAIPPQPLQQGIEISDYLLSKSMRVIDKRGNGGALWVVGGWELKDTLLALKEQGFYFRYARSGSQSTKREPAWFLAGNDPSAKRYLAEELELVTETAAAAEDLVAPHAERTAVDEPVHHHGIKPYDDHGDLEEDAHPNPSEEVSGVKVPSYLQWSKVASYKPSRMSDIAESLGIIYFNDWSENRLRELYRHQPKLLHEVLVQLWFYGFGFEGELSRFIKLERPEEWAAIPAMKPGVWIRDILALDIVRQLERFGITVTDQLAGLPEQSLIWLFRTKYDSVMEALQPYIIMGKAEVIVEETALPEQEEHARIVRSAQYEIEIPAHLLKFPIEGLPINGCSALLSGIRNQCGITRLGGLPEDLTTLLPSIKGAGPGALEKMAAQLQSFVNLQNMDEASSGTAVPEGSSSRIESPALYNQSAAQSMKLIWNGQVTELQESDLAMPLIAAEYAIMVKRVARYLEERNITTLGSLPAMLDQLSQGDRIGATSIEKFAALLLARLEEYRADKTVRELLETMTMSERIGYYLGKSADKLSLKVSENERNSNRNLQIIHSRWQETSKGGKATLESLGQKYGLTRERVRQIVPKVLQSFHPDVVELERALIEACRNHNGYYYYPLNVQDDFLYGLMEQVLEAQEGLVYLAQYGWWTTETQEAMDEKEADLRKHMNVQLRGRVWDEAALTEVIADKIGEDRLPMKLAREMIASDLAMTADGNYYLANSKKAEVVEMVLRQFPEGVEVYKREPELMELANVIKPGEYVKERDFTSVFVRDEFMDTAYLWGRGTFIHRDYVKADERLIREVSDKALEFLEKRSPISVNRLFPIYERRLRESGIPTEYALYTMLRKLGSSQLAPNKFPHIWHADDAFQLSNAEQIKAYIRERHEPIAMERLREEFVGKRGWKKFTLEFSIQTDSDFVSVDFGIIGLREFYPFTEQDYAPLIDKLQALLDETGVIHVNRLFELASDICSPLGIGSSYLLYDLLKGQEAVDGRFRMVRYPLIMAIDHPAEDLTLQTLVEQYLEEQEAETARELVYHWVTEEVGARPDTLDIVLSASSDIFYYQEGQFGEYIHRSRFGWTEAREKLLVRMVNIELEVQQAFGAPYVTIQRIMDRLPLPELDNDVAWSEDLLKDCLRKSGRFLMIGSYDYIVAKREHSVIANETDWLKWVLVQEYGGRAPRAQWHRRLADLKYSMDGKFLFETLTKLESGIAPFVVTDDEVVLVEDMAKLE